MLYHILPYGRYETWADNGDADPNPVRIVGCDEVNATVTTDLPIFDNRNDVELLRCARSFCRC